MPALALRFSGVSSSRTSSPASSASSTCTASGRSLRARRLAPISTRTFVVGSVPRCSPSAAQQRRPQPHTARRVLQPRTLAVLSPRIPRATALATSQGRRRPAPPLPPSHGAYFLGLVSLPHFLHCRQMCGKRGVPVRTLVTSEEGVWQRPSTVATAA